MDNVATTVCAVRVNNPAPTISGNGAAIAPCPTGSSKLAAHVGKNKAAGKCTRATAFRLRSADQMRGKSAISYARQRAGYAPTEIQVLNDDWNVVETISSETVRGLI